MKKFRVCIASRYMYNEYREYDIYYVNAKSFENAMRYAKRVVSHWNSKDNSTTYEIDHIDEVA